MLKNFLRNFQTTIKSYFLFKLNYIYYMFFSHSSFNLEFRTCQKPFNVEYLKTNDISRSFSKEKLLENLRKNSALKLKLQFPRYKSRSADAREVFIVDRA